MGLIEVMIGPEGTEPKHSALRQPHHAATRKPGDVSVSTSRGGVTITYGKELLFPEANTGKGAEQREKREEETVFQKP